MNYTTIVYLIGGLVFTVMFIEMLTGIFHGAVLKPVKMYKQGKNDAEQGRPARRWGRSLSRKAYLRGYNGR